MNYLLMMTWLWITYKMMNMILLVYSNKSLCWWSKSSSLLSKHTWELDFQPLCFIHCVCQSHHTMFSFSVGASCFPASVPLLWFSHLLGLPVSHCHLIVSVPNHQVQLTLLCAMKPAPVLPFKLKSHLFSSDYSILSIKFENCVWRDVQSSMVVTEKRGSDIRVTPQNSVR